MGFQRSFSHCFVLLLALLVSDTSFGQRKGVASPQKYCAIHAKHTLCLYQDSVSSSCGQVTERGLSQEERDLVTHLHNQRRAFVANGREKRGNPGPQPPAANMMQLTYDEELEAEAQAWTDQCVRNHECPDCRILDRFKVGQNLFWYGHFIGSWEKSVEGWYDEVADFNSSFVYPFYVIPGVLVGHYTQLMWAQTTKIGCGKLFSYPKPELSRLGQEFYICNYGLAGNLIKSEMYKVGKPCSACPQGTSCSRDFPGLCTGEPRKPLTIRPPKHDHVFTGLPTRKPIIQEVVEAPPVVLPPVFVEAPSTPEGRDRCSYGCKPGGSCSVAIEAASPFSVSGSVLGSCFSQSFGGECSGTPKKCQKCSKVCRGRENVRILVELNEDGSEASRTSEPLGPSQSGNGGEVAATGSADKGRTCTYNCQNHGGCSVRVNPSSPSDLVSGPVLGSCFSPDFGGECSGTPNDCRDCLDVCEQNGLGEHTLPST